MTQEEYQREQEELQRLINEYNALVARRNQLVNEYNYLAEELTYSLNATVETINYAVKVRNYILPRLEDSKGQVVHLSGLVKAVQDEIDSLSNKYFVIKNISKASKKLTQLNNEYQRNFGLYNTLRRVALGYVVGVDQNIISNERLRVTVEKNYLQNADYWISHCLMATMLWVSDEPEAANRAMEKALSIDEHKSSLYFLLVNLRFGRSEAAAKWFEYYVKDINVMNIGDEIRILLQAYLYNICGEEQEFKDKIRLEFKSMLAEVREKTPNYEGTIKNRVLEFISAHVHKSADEFIELQNSCHDYKQIIQALESAEKNSIFARYFTELYEADESAPRNLTERIQNVLYDLINTYDEAEMAIMKDMDYNEMILSARGDLDAARKMYNLKYQPQKAQTLGDLMIKLALPVNVEEVDIRVRKFAVTFICKSVINAFEDFKKQYNELAKDVHDVSVDTFTVKVDEKKPSNAMQELKDLYKKNRNKFIRQDKGVKTLTIFTIIFWAIFAGSAIFAGVRLSQQQPWGVALIIIFALSFIGAVGFTVWLMFRRRKAGAHVEQMMDAGMEKLRTIIKTIQDWRNQFKLADEQSVALVEALSKFINEVEEEGTNE